jgi:hypothetical protein
MSEAPGATWTVHLARTRPGRALAGFACFVAVGVVVGVAQGQVLFGVLAFAALFGSTATFWLPRRYALFEDRIEMTPWGWRRPLVYPFARFRAAFADESSVFLSALDRTTGLARYRGLTVYLNPGDAELVARIVERVGSVRNGAP